MKQTDQPDHFKALLKTAAEILGYPAVIISFILALSGRVPGQYPVTTSLLTMLITVVLVMGWRWRAIRRQQSSLPSGLILPATARPAKISPLREWSDPLQSFSRKQYVYSLGRRRAESGILLGMVLFTLGWTGARFPSAVNEFDLAQDSCQAQKTKPLRVLIANIQDTGGSPELQVEDRLYDILSQYGDGKFSVCRWRESVAVRSQAQEIARKFQADMVIWGRKDVIYEINLEVPGWKTLNRALSVSSAEEATSPGFQFTEPEHLGYVTEFALSELIFLSGEAAEAQQRLLLALNRFQNDALAGDHKNDVAEGYFLLGLFFDPSTGSSQADPQRAIEYYTQALAWQENLYVAVLNRAGLRSMQGQYADAIADYSLLIDRDTPLKGSAYINRAFLQSDRQAAESDVENAIRFTQGIERAQGYYFRAQMRMMREDYAGAAADLEQAIALDPGGYQNYHALGLLQLAIGQLDQARTTYRNMIPYLDEASRQQVLDELAQSVQARPDLQPAIERITADLKAARLSTAP